MLGSNRCYLNKEYRKKIEKNNEFQECTYDPLGYFVIKGVEKVMLV